MDHEIQQFFKCPFWGFSISLYLSFHEVSSPILKNRSVIQKAKKCHWGFDFVWMTNNLDKSLHRNHIDPSWFLPFAKAMIYNFSFKEFLVGAWDENRSIQSDSWRSSMDITTKQNSNQNFRKFIARQFCNLWKMWKFDQNPH